MSALQDIAIITQRQLRLLTRVPEVLIFSTIQPVMFVLLFRYVFGGSIDTGRPGGYVQLLKVLDRYPLQLPVKGGFVYAQYTTVIITSIS